MRMTINLGFTLLAFLEISCSGLGIHPQRKDITDAVFASGNIFDENEYTVTVADDEYLKKSFVKEGDKVVFDKVLLVDDGKNTTIGTPFIEKASVKATVVKIGREPKVVVVHYKQKSRYFKKNGHKQPFVQVKIDALK